MNDPEEHLREFYASKRLSPAKISKIRSAARSQASGKPWSAGIGLAALLLICLFVVPASRRTKSTPLPEGVTALDGSLECERCILHRTENCRLVLEFSTAGITNYLDLPYSTAVSNVDAGTCQHPRQVHISGIISGLGERQHLEPTRARSLE